MVSDRPFPAAMWSMPGMSPIEGDAFADADDLAPWSIPGIEEEELLLEEPQAARISARAVAVPAAARGRRRTVGREEVDMGGLSGWAHHAGRARGDEQDTLPGAR